MKRSWHQLSLLFCGLINLFPDVRSATLAEVSSFNPQAIYEIEDGDLGFQYGFDKSNSPPRRSPSTTTRSEGSPNFFAVPSSQSSSGLIPIFEVDSPTGRDWRRLPSRGQENSAEAQFWVLPPSQDSTAHWSGHWLCSSTRGSTNRSIWAMDLFVQDGKVTGRFDQNSDFRPAYLPTGEIRSNTITLIAEYFQDRYRLTGTWDKKRWRGEWHHQENEESGTWEATREAPNVPSTTSFQTIDIFLWTHSNSSQKRLAPIESNLGPEWSSGKQPLFRAWRP